MAEAATQKRNKRYTLAELLWNLELYEKDRFGNNEIIRPENERLVLWEVQRMIEDDIQGQKR